MNLQPLSSNSQLLKKACIGILGSGQLGMMMAEAAKKMGHRVVVYDSAADGPACLIADESIIASFEDEEALKSFAAKVDLITLEFENIPAKALTFLTALKPLFPSSQVVQICQDRVLEKEFLQAHQFPVAPFAVITSLQELKAAVKKLQSPCILKTATQGYDGKGQCLINPDDDLKTIWNSFNSARAILEKKINFQTEASIIIARSLQGEVVCFSPQENEHRHGILNISFTPPYFNSEISKKAEFLGKKIAETLQVVGLITVEFFVLSTGELLVNELAPRPHNSGHHTLESCRTSQFEQAIRAVTGRTLGSPELLSNAVMVNLLGDLWKKGEPDWSKLKKNLQSTLHLYGKKQAKPGRKMGHLTIVGDTRDQLLVKAREFIKEMTV